MIRSRPHQHHPILPILTRRDCWSAADLGSVCDVSNATVACGVSRMVLVVLLVMKDRLENHVLWLRLVRLCYFVTRIFFTYMEY